MSEDYDAVGVEYDFAGFFGAAIGHRGLPHDADVFRCGEPSGLGRLVIMTADRLEDRANTLQFSPSDMENGGLKAKLEVSIGQLRRCGQWLGKRKAEEPEDHHWLIVGPLVQTVDVLLKKLGA